MHSCLSLTLAIPEFSYRCNGGRRLHRLWTNWSRGPIFGTTLTINRNYGTLLISFTAVFIGFVASRFWRAACFSLHRFYSTSKPGHLIYHQSQITLRNATAPEAGFWSIAQLLWAWRKSRAKSLTQILPAGLLAVARLITFTIAGGFSSGISTAVGDEVLIQGSNCGILQAHPETAEDLSSYNSLFSELTDNAATYAQQCYDTESANPSNFSFVACDTFVVKKLPTTSVNYSAPCPFDEKLCYNKTSNIRLDTGYISNDKLGFNIPSGDGLA